MRICLSNNILAIIMKFLISTLLQGAKIFSYNILKIEFIYSTSRIFILNSSMHKKESLSILLVEDDKYFSFELGKTLSLFGHFDLCSNLNQAQALLDKNSYDLAIIDLNLDSSSSPAGLAVLKKTKSKNIYSIILSNNEDDETTREAYKLGCDHFLRKSTFRDSLNKYLESYLRVQKKINWNEYFSQKFITQNSALIQNIQNLAEMNLQNSAILLFGPTGSGKTHLAKLIHELNYDNKNFFHFNCSEVPENLIESELFGYKKGAFTGAQSSKKGLLELADNGTLFLDEIATMPLYTQQKLLKVLEEKEFTPIGATKPIKVNFTLISATCEDIQEKIDLKQFRQDLYYRINGFEITIPSLQTRPEDVELQIYHFLSKTSRKFFIEQDVIQSLLHYSWPGNTRELKKLISNLSLSKEGIITNTHPIIQNLKIKTNNTNTVLSNKQLNYINQFGLKSFISEVEKEAITNAHKLCKGKATEVIKTLKISNSSYYRIINNNTQQ